MITKMITKCLYSNIAKDVWPNGGVLGCSVCGHEKEMSTRDGAYYLCSGWPKCCGITMHLKMNPFKDKRKD